MAYKRSGKSKTESIGDVQYTCPKSWVKMFYKTHTITRTENNKKEMLPAGTKNKHRVLGKCVWRLYLKIKLKNTI